MRDQTVQTVRTVRTRSHQVAPGRQNHTVQLIQVLTQQKTKTPRQTHDTRHKKKHRHSHSHRHSHRLRSEIDRDTRDRPRIADIESPIHRVTETHTHSQSQHHIASAQMTPPVSSLRPPPRDARRDSHPVMHTLIHVANVRVKAQAPSGKS